MAIDALPLERGKSVRLEAVRVRSTPLLPDLAVVRKAGGRRKSANVRIAYEIGRRRADRLGRELGTESGDYDRLGEDAFEYAYRVLVGE